MDVLGLIAQFHQALTVLAALAAAGVLVLAPAGYILLRRDASPAPRIPAALDWLVLAVPLLAAFAAVLGIVLLAGTGGPRDGLHAVYGAVAVVTLPLARIMGAGPPPGPEAEAADAARSAPAELTRQLAAWLALGALVTLGTLLRLAGTG